MQLRIVDVTERRCNIFDIALVAMYLRVILKRIIESLQHGQRRKNSNTAVFVNIEFYGFKVDQKKVMLIGGADFYEEYTRARTSKDAKLSQRFCTCQFMDSLYHQRRLLSLLSHHYHTTSLSALRYGREEGMFMPADQGHID